MFSRSVDVLVADLPDVEIDEDLLSVSELGRALWFTSPSQLTEYLAAHTWLRRRLSEYLDYAPADIRFEKDEHGKPVIVEPATDLSFNLAYSGGMAALVVGFRKAVGIDVEMTEGTETYSQHWVRRESLVKAEGLCTAQDPETIDVSGPSPIAVDGYEITDLNFGSGFVAAVATPPGTRINVSIVVGEAKPAPVAEQSPLQLAGVGR